MQITAAVFSDPAMRSSLQQFYEQKKASAVEAWKMRESQPVGEVKFQKSDGTVQTANAIPISAEKMEKAFVSFDKWLELQQTLFDNDGFGPKRLQMAEERLAHLAENSPDTSSNVRTTFSDNGTLLAYVNADGTMVSSNGADRSLQSVEQAADQKGLSGQGRVDFLSREIHNVLSQKYRDLNITRYDDASAPTKSEFGKMYYAHFDVDQHYNDALKDAQDSLKEAQAWNKQWQANMNEIQTFLLKLQEKT